MSERRASEPKAPPLPPGKYLDLPGRGRTFWRETGPTDGVAAEANIVLLHGWTASADLNWFPAFAPLSRRYRVIAPDHRGHGRGIRSRRRFRLTDCADDAAALLDHLTVGPQDNRPVIVVGYSMGGPVAKLLWLRRPDLVSGLVLCATARTFASRASEKGWFAGLAGLSMASRFTPGMVRSAMADHLLSRRSMGMCELDAWVVNELARSDWTAVLEAGAALGNFDSRRWADTIDVPTAVVATMNDGIVAPARQLALARAISESTLHRVDGNHTVCVGAPERFVPVLDEALASVTARLSTPSTAPAVPS